MGELLSTKINKVIKKKYLDNVKVVAQVNGTSVGEHGLCNLNAAT